jgi:hypothetical protein
MSPSGRRPLITLCGTHGCLEVVRNEVLVPLGLLVPGVGVPPIEPTDEMAINGSIRR